MCSAVCVMHGRWILIGFLGNNKIVQFLYDSFRIRCPVNEELSRSFAGIFTFLLPLEWVLKISSILLDLHIVDFLCLGEKVLSIWKLLFQLLREC